MSDGPPVPSPTQVAPRRRRAWLAANLPLVLLGVFVVVLLVANALWLWSNRHHGAFNIDEAGYLGLSLDDYNALRHDGPAGLARAILHQPTHAPLVPALSSLAYLVAGRASLLGAFAVQLIAYAVVVTMTFLTGRLLVNRWAALVAAIAVAALPAMVVYAHDYSFAIPAAAATTVTIWGALRSELLTRKRFAIVWGIALGAMVITRTMTIAFLPSFAVLAVVQVAASRCRKSSLVGLACGAGAALLVAGPWYAAQGRTVWAYLTSFGYGAASAGFGTTRPLFSLSAWLPFARDNVNQFVWLPLTLVLVAGAVTLVVLLVARLVRHGLALRELLASPWFFLAVVVGEGLLALMSSRNRGSGFLAPLLPVMMLLAVAALARALEGRRSLGYAVMAVVVVLSLPSLIATTAFNTAGLPAAADLPGLGHVVVLDARGPFVLYAVQEGEFNVKDPEGVAWRRANDAITAGIDGLPRSVAHLPVVLAFDHSLVNVNTLELNELGTHASRPEYYVLTPAADGEAGYKKQLDAALGDRSGVVLVSSDTQGMFPPLLDQDAVRAALTSSGFATSRSVTLPDGASVELWSR